MRLTFGYNLELFVRVTGALLSWEVLRLLVETIHLFLLVMTKEKKYLLIRAKSLTDFRPKPTKLIMLQMLLFYVQWESG